MADVAESGSYADAASAISQGKRHLLVQDYTAAVTAFAEGLEMMSQKLGDCDDELGEPYLLYGRALLGLAREEAGVLGGGVPGSEDADEDEDVDDEDAEDEKLSDVDEKDEESEETDEKKSAESAETTKTKTESEEPKKEEKKEEEKDDKTTSNETDDKKMEEQKLQKSPVKIKEAAAATAASAVASGETKTTEKKPEAKAESVESVAGSSKVEANGSATKAEKSCNGAAGKSDEAEDGEDVSKDDDEEDPGRGIDLQVAWEVLELAKIVFAKRGESGLKNLAETHRLLGEVAMESDNPQGAITDLEGALKLLQKIEPCEPRAIAELHYQLGLAHSLLNDFDASIGQFKEATTLLEARIKQLEGLEEPPKNPDDPFYTVEGEIKELKELLPAIQEKITDMKDFKEEACRLVIEGIKNKVAAGGCTNGAGSSNDDGAASSSSSQPAVAAAAVSPKNAKPASDISHLVRKKRKAEEVESPAQSPCKKPTP